ncbi:uncharacterized protein LOC109820573 isoform X2 [Asparagus officinalis]|uniref:uncharacterized protein LOC109820573 isoform X2 n=1 Tax=Asparagus officinalis TaxID=4686 RepID=UPI00098E1A9A|nr:uncharacterized protein LOC109820573 isoform X2 [Asparagus officinalis]
MVHLAVHLPREAMLAGPVQYRWMYPIERFLGTLKGYVTNRARPEGSIAEAYIAKECLTFCSLYLKGVVREERNVDCGILGPGLSVFTQSARPFGPITRAPNVSQKDLDMAQWFVLYNSPELEPFLEEHKATIQNSRGHDITQIQRKEFSKWFKQHINHLRTIGSPRATDELWSLANGPDILVHLYEGCICNGVRFHTKDRDNRRKSQNSGLVVEGDHDGKTIDFYGYLCKVWELKYLHGVKVVLFQCEWFNTGGKNRIHKDTHITSIDVRGRWYQNDPFVLPEHVKQVFYIDDTKLGAHWKVVERVQHRSVWDVPEQVHDDMLNDAFQQVETTVAVPILVEPTTNYPYYRDDIGPNIIPSADLNTEYEVDNDQTMEEYGDDEEDNLHNQADLDIDPDIDYDV